MTGKASERKQPKGEINDMDCNHDLQFLMGTADGIVCRACGRVFKDFAEIQGVVDAPAPEKPAEKAEAAPKKGRKKK